MARPPSSDDRQRFRGVDTAPRCNPVIERFVSQPPRRRWWAAQTPVEANGAAARMENGTLLGEAGDDDRPAETKTGSSTPSACRPRALRSAFGSSSQCGSMITVDMVVVPLLETHHHRPPRPCM